MIYLAIFGGVIFALIVIMSLCKAAGKIGSGKWE